MDWMRSRDVLPAMARHSMEPLREPDVDADGSPKFVLVDAKNRVRELTAPISIHHNSPAMSIPVPRAAGAGFHDADENMDDDAQLEQQLQFQREEMRFGRAPLPRISPPPSHPFRPQQSTSPLTTAPTFLSSRPTTAPPAPAFNHAYTYTESNAAFANPLKTPPTVPPISPFAGMALSAPAKSTIGSMAKPPVNPFGSTLSTSVESSPRLLPSLNAFRAGSPRTLKMGIAARPPPLSLRSSSPMDVAMASPSVQPMSLPPPSPLPSLSSSMPSPHHSSMSPYSQSLPGLSFLHERLSRQPSFDGAESATNGSSDDDEREPAMLMMQLSSSMPTSSAMSQQRSGRVCRYADCNNIARSRGLCRTHGGGKRCSHPGCNKSAQANRKCIAHGGGTPCSFEDCEKTAQSRGLCKAHGGGARCKHPNCPKSSQSKGLCRGHGGGIKCKEDGCEKWVQKNGYCIKHGRERSMTQ
ncbi:hypothetical protein ATCC90586_010007 [Pythium insidiosum]|nr:hypothetical protein ATCC90586_010007 [Pythium insidiosum]